jgi:hypothetical protein
MDKELQVELLYWARRVINIHWHNAAIKQETPYVELDKVVKSCLDTPIGDCVLKREISKVR